MDPQLQNDGTIPKAKSQIESYNHIFKPVREGICCSIRQGGEYLEMAKKRDTISYSRGLISNNSNTILNWNTTTWELAFETCRKATDRKRVETDFQHCRYLIVQI